MKICSKCGKRKRDTAFHKNARTRSGLRSECKDCTMEMTRLYRIKTRPDTKTKIENGFVGEFVEIRSLCEKLLILVNKAERGIKAASIRRDTLVNNLES